MSKKWLATAVAALMALSILAGCSGSKVSAGYKVGMSTDVGGLNDNSFNAAAWRGLQKAEKELKAEVKPIESKRAEDYEVNFQTLMDAKYDLIWGIGFMMHDAVEKMAKANPDQKFAIIDSEVTGQKNVASVLFKEQEGSFLEGIIAGKITKTNKIGFVGGMEGDVIGRFEAGFRAGVKAVNPNAQVIVVYSGKFDDAAKGKSDALSIYSQGADVIFHAAGFTGTGVIDAAKEQNKWVIGVDSDQKSLAPNNVISSMMKRVDNAVFDISKLAASNKFPGGQTTVLGLKENGVGYSDTTMWDKMPADTQKLVDKWADAIKSGKVTVPTAPKDVNGWTVPKI